MNNDIKHLKSQHEAFKRKLAIKLLSEGLTQSKVADVFDVTRETINRWSRQYEQHGDAALTSLPRGRSEGEKRHLGPEEEADLIQKMTDYHPDQLGIDSALWTRRAVAELIRKTLIFNMPIRTVGAYLMRWGMTPQKPSKRAYEQNPKAIKRWLNDDYPAIHARAKQEKAEIYWGDETGIRSNCQHGRGYARKGQTPEVNLSARRASINMISAITNQGTVRFHLYEGTMNAQRFITFLKRLIKDTKRKVFFIIDNLTVHHALMVKDWVKENADRIELFYLPPYSPERNPDEYLNGALKQAIHSRSPVRSAKKLKARVLSYMRSLQQFPDKVCGFFNHRHIRYAGSSI